MGLAGLNEGVRRAAPLPLLSPPVRAVMNISNTPITQLVSPLHILTQSHLQSPLCQGDTLPALGIRTNTTWRSRDSTCPWPWLTGLLPKVGKITSGLEASSEPPEYAQLGWSVVPTLTPSLCSHQSPVSRTSGLSLLFWF